MRGLSVAQINASATNRSSLTGLPNDVTGLSFTGANYSGSDFRYAHGLSAANMKTAAVGGLTGIKLTGSGITRAMLSTRPSAELNSITW